MTIVKKNKERIKEFNNLKEKENECIQYCTAIEIFKRKIIETESILLGQLITTINTYANIYLDGFFKDQTITVELSPYKKLKKSSKNQINLIISYKGEECDFNNLSGGEQTRIILAYTMAFSEILNSPFVMLDEAMSSLDQDTTDIVSKTIKYNCKNKIIILVAHQVVQGNFDSIISLD
jgi:DNA repair exonuclease SbcCD ATPase subunit